MVNISAGGSASTLARARLSHFPPLRTPAAQANLFCTCLVPRHVLADSRATATSFPAPWPWLVGPCETFPGHCEVFFEGSTGALGSSSRILRRLGTRQVLYHVSWPAVSPGYGSVGVTHIKRTRVIIGNFKKNPST